MNDFRRKTLRSIDEKLTEILDELDSVENAEKDCRDSIPGPLQQGKKYEQADAVCDALHDAIGYVEEAVRCVREAAK